MKAQPMNNLRTYKYSRMKIKSKLTFQNVKNEKHIRMKFKNY